MKVIVPAGYSLTVMQGMDADPRIDTATELPDLPSGSDVEANEKAVWSNIKGDTAKVLKPEGDDAQRIIHFEELSPEMHPESSVHRHVRIVAVPNVSLCIEMRDGSFLELMHVNDERIHVEAHLAWKSDLDAYDSTFIYRIDSMFGQEFVRGRGGGPQTTFEPGGDDTRVLTVGTGRKPRVDRTVKGRDLLQVTRGHDFGLD
jgi:hypothetical protein